MQHLLKYLLWATTSVVAIGAWFFDFTAEGEAGRQTLTRWGAIFLPILLASFGLASWRTIQDERDQRAAAVEAKERASRTSADLDDIKESQGEMLALLTQPGVLDAAMSTSAGRQRVQKALSNPHVRASARLDPRLRAVLDSLEQRLGGKDEIVARLAPRHPDARYSAETIAVLTTFGLRHFRQDTPLRTRQAIARTIKGREPDVLALQEIRSDAALDTLMSDLPEYRALLSQSGGRMRQALLCRRDRVRLVGDAEEIPGADFDRRPLVQRVDLGGVVFDMMCVHLKSRAPRRESADPGSVARRTRQVEDIVRWIEAKTDDVPTVVAGTFHAETDAPEMRAIAEAGGTFATADLPAEARTFLLRRGAVGKIAHFALFGDIKDRYIAGSSRVDDLETLLPEWTTEEIVHNISDHNPVSIVLDLEAG